MGIIVGIDLGTTNSAIADLSGEDMSGVKARIIRNSENERLTPSVVAFRKGEFYIGTPALRVFPLEPKNTIISVKRLMGRAILDPEVQKMKSKYLYEIVEPSDGTKDSVRVKLGGREYSPIDISAMILRKLKEDAERVIGKEITHAVITVPAYFSDKQREATREAGRRAGLKVMRILDEPTAAAIAYGITVEIKETKWVLVYDLGGGTFDVSILAMSAGASSVVHLEGDMWLGGDDFDQVIIDYVVERIRDEYGIDPKENHRFMAHLRLEARKAKEILSSSRVAEIIITGYLQDKTGNPIDVDFEISREWFEERIEPLVERTIFLTKKALSNQGLTPDDIDYVVMAGNATLIPKVQEAVESLFGKEKVKRIVHPKEAVAIGAAIVAAMLRGIECGKCGYINDLEAKRCEKCGKDLDLTEKPKKTCPYCGTENSVEAERCEKCGKDLLSIPSGGVAPFHYGIQTAGDKFNVFVRKGDPYPTPEENRIIQTFYTRYPNQRFIAIPVYGGVNLEYASKNEKQGEAIAILPPNLSEGTPIRIRLWLNKHGHFEVEAYLEDGTDLKPWIMRGEKDQLVIEKLEEVGKLIVENEGNLSPDKKIKINELQEEVLDNMKEKNFDGALNKVNELRKIIDEPPQPPDTEKVIMFAHYLTKKYDWIIGPASVHTLNNLIKELEDAISENDSAIIKIKLNALMNEIDMIVEKNPLLNHFLVMYIAIAQHVYPVLPADAKNLMEELDDIEIAFKNKQPYAMEMLNAFTLKLEEAIKKVEDIIGEIVGSKMIKCPKCGHLNSFSNRYCVNCGADLWITGLN